MLIETAISEVDVVEMLRWFIDLSYVDLPAVMHREDLDALAERLIRADFGEGSELRSSSMSMVTSKSSKSSMVATKSSMVTAKSSKKEVRPKVTVIVDISNREAVSSGHVLCKLMLPSVAHTPEAIPQMLLSSTPDAPQVEAQAAPCSPLVAGTRLCLVICTKGSLTMPEYLCSLLWAAVIEAAMLPVVCEDDFLFPSEQVYAYLESQCNTILSAMPSCPEVAKTCHSILAEVVRYVCEEIAVVLRPHASRALLETQAAACAQRSMALFTSDKQANRFNQILMKSAALIKSTRVSDRRVSEHDAGGGEMTSITPRVERFVGDEGEMTSITPRVERFVGEGTTTTWV